jgi:Trypsin-like peptidase domain/GYF domain 2
MDVSNAVPQKPQEYHVLVEGQMHGPFTLDALKAALESGDITLEDFVQVGGLPIWRPLAQILNSPPPLSYDSPALAESEALESRESHSESVPPVPANQIPTMSSGAGVPDWKQLADWTKARLRSDFEERSVGIGLVCLGVGVVTCIAARWPFLFWLPWFGLAFFAGFGALKRGQTMQGVGLLVGACALPILFSMVLPIHRVHTPQPSDVYPEPATPTPRAKAESVRASQPASDAESASRSPQTVAPFQIESVRSTRSAEPAPSTPLPGKAPATPAIPVQSATPAPKPNPAPVGVPRPAPKPLESAVPAAREVPATKTAETTLPPFGLIGTASGDAAIGGDLVLKHRDCFVVIKDGSASGSGFICRDGQKTWLYTNVHVGAGMRNPQFNRLDGSQIRVGAAEAGGGRDVMRLAVTDAMQPLEVMQNLDAAARIGDEVVVMGNSGGGGVVTTLPGKLVGIGPDRIEVSAEFIPGNSGSPIVHVPTGKVIGIATYLIKRYDEFSPTNSRSGKPEVATVRRFGYRLDGIQKWEAINWTAFHAESEQLRQISALTEDVFDFLDCVRRHAEPQFETETLRRPASEWLSGVRRSQVSVADRNRATQNFLSSLRFMVRADMTAAENRIRYSYFRERLRKEREVRDSLYKAFDDEVKVMSSPSLR